MGHCAVVGEHDEVEFEVVGVGVLGKYGSEIEEVGVDIFNLLKNAFE